MPPKHFRNKLAKAKQTQLTPQKSSFQAQNYGQQGATAFPKVVGGGAGNSPQGANAFGLQSQQGTKTAAISFSQNKSDLRFTTQSNFTTPAKPTFQKSSIGLGTSFSPAQTGQTAPVFQLKATNASISTSSNIAQQQTSTQNADDEKRSWEDEVVDEEVLAVYNDMKQYFDDIKKIKSSIQQHISNKMDGVVEIISILRRRLLAVSASVEGSEDDITRLKTDTIQIASDTNLCERLLTADARSLSDPFSSSQSPVTDYFWRLLAHFEKQLSVFRARTRDLELIVSTPSATTAQDSANALQELLEMQAQAFVDLCAQAQRVHEASLNLLYLLRVSEEAEKYRQFHKNIPKSSSDADDPFATPREKDNEDTNFSSTAYGFGAPYISPPNGNLNVLGQWQQQTPAQGMATVGSVQPWAQAMGAVPPAMGAVPSPFGQKFGSSSSFGNQFGKTVGNSPFGQQQGQGQGQGQAGANTGFSNQFGKTIGNSPFGQQQGQGQGQGQAGANTGFSNQFGKTVGNSPFGQQQGQ
eukprot:gene6785-9486_t